MRLLVGSLIVALGMVAAASADDTWLTWQAKKAETIGRAARVTGRVGGYFDTRILSTNTSYNYKLAATWMNPEVVRASARMAQITHRLTPAEAKRLVEEAEAVEGSTTTHSLFSVRWTQLELVVRIAGKEGRVKWAISESVRSLMGVTL